MTLDELRKVEDFLDEAAELRMSLNEARKYVSARILGNTLHEARLDLDLNEIEQICELFLGDRS